MLSLDSNTEMRSAGSRTPPKRSTRGFWRLLIGLAGAIVYLMAWALASPVGSSADDSFHLPTIWCAWGPSETCAETAEPGTFLVPSSVGDLACFALTSNSASCVDEVAEGWTTAAPDLFYNPPVFYLVLRAFVTESVDGSVLAMRTFNILLAAAIWLLAYFVSGSRARSALVISWLIGLVPVAAFFIPSTNPSSWAIIGLGTFWAFYYALRTYTTTGGVPRISIWVGALLSSGIALGSKSDSAYGIAVSIVAVEVILYGGPLRRAWNPFAVAGAALAAAVLSVYVIFTRAGDFIHFLAAWAGVPQNTATDQPNGLAKLLLELPAFAASFTGFQGPVWSQRTTMLDAQDSEYAQLGLTYGVGHTDTIMPSLVWAAIWLVGGAFLMQVLRKEGARGFLLLVFLAAAWSLPLILLKVAFAFEPYNLQPRYMAPLALAALGLLAVSSRPTTAANKVQRGLASAALWIASSVGLAALLARYAHGQAHSFLELDALPRWQWSGLPQLGVWAIATAALLSTFIVALSCSSNRVDSAGQGQTRA